MVAIVDRSRRWAARRGWTLSVAEGRAQWTWTSLGGAGLLVGLIVCLLIPVAPGVVDLLLALSVAVSLVLVVASLRVEHPMQLRWFPTMVLCATLFRLCINVSTTRLIPNAPLMSWQRVKSEACGDLRHTTRAPRNHQELHGRDDQKDHRADDQVAPNHRARERRDDLPRVAVGQDQARRRDVDAQPK